jgi:hypothetical protein
VEAVRHSTIAILILALRTTLQALYHRSDLTQTIYGD